MKRFSRFYAECVLRRKLPNAEIFLIDAWYVFPGATWIVSEAKEHFGEMLTTLGLTNYYSEPNTSDDFAVLFATLTRAFHSKNYPKLMATLATFEMWYRSDILGGHIVNVSILEDGNLIFTEPQRKCESLELSSSELQSCWFVR